MQYFFIFFYFLTVCYTEIANISLSSTFSGMNDIKQDLCLVYIGLVHETTKAVILKRT